MPYVPGNEDIYTFLDVTYDDEHCGLKCPFCSYRRTDPTIDAYCEYFDEPLYFGKRMRMKRVDNCVMRSEMRVRRV